MRNEESKIKGKPLPFMEVDSPDGQAVALRLCFVELKYDEQRTDTVAFTCPPTVTDDELNQALSEELAKAGDDAHVDDALTRTAERLEATWEYMPDDEWDLPDGMTDQT